MIKNRFELARYFAKLGFKKGAEIGVAQGYYSKILLDNIPGLELLCIDSWSLPRWKDYYSEAQELLKSYKRAKLIRKPSMDTLIDIPEESLDFVFIDAEHSYESVKEDVNGWAKKVRHGGIVSGHDYYKTRHGNTGVIDAVNEYVKEKGYQLELTEWNNEDPNQDERQPSWYFTRT